MLTVKQIGAYHHLTAGRARHRRALPARHLRRGLGRRAPARATWPAAASGSTGSGRPAATAPPSSSSSSRPAPASRWLAGLPAGTRVEVTGPLGRPFALPKEPVSLPAGRRGVRRRPAVPARRAAARARLRRHHAARRARRGAPARRARGPPLRPRGHRGHRRRLGRPKGTVADVVDDVLGRAQADVVYAAGPHATSARGRGRRRAPRRLEPDRRSRCRQPCGTGLCLGCAGAGRRRGRRRRHRPRLRRRPGASAATGSAGPTWRMSVELAGLDLTSRCWSPPAAAAPAASSRRTRRASAALGGFVTRSITLDARRGGPGPAGRGDAVGLRARDRAAEPRPRQLPRHRAAVAGRGTGTRVVRLDRRPLAGGVRRARAPARALARRRRDRGEPRRARRDRAVRRREPFQAASVVAAVKRDLPARRAGAGQAPPRPGPRRRDRPGGRSRPAPTRSWSATPSRPRCPTAAAGRPERPGDPPARAALRHRGARRPAGGCTSSAAVASRPRADARAFLAAGATAVQIGTALLHDPTTAARIAAELEPGARTMTFGARLHAAIDRARPVLRRHRPARRRCCTTGASTDDVGRARAVRDDRGRGASPPYVSVVKPQSAFFERYGSRGIAVLERVVAELPGRRRAGPARREARRHRLDAQAYADAYLDPSSPLAVDAITASPFLGFGSLDPMVDTARSHDAGVVRARPDLQPGGAGGAARARRRRRHRRRPACSTSCAGSTPAPSRSARSARSSAPPSASTDEDLAFNGPLLAPGFGAQGGTVADVRRIFGAAARRAAELLPRDAARRPRPGRAARRRPARQRGARRMRPAPGARGSRWRSRLLTGCGGRRDGRLLRRGRGQPGGAQRPRLRGRAGRADRRALTSSATSRTRHPTTSATSGSSSSAGSRRSPTLSTTPASTPRRTTVTTRRPAHRRGEGPHRRGRQGARQRDDAARTAGPRPAGARRVSDPAEPLAVLRSAANHRQLLLGPGSD